MPGSLALVCLLVAATIWCVASALEWSAGGLEQKYLWSQVQYLGVATLPVAWLVFSLHSVSNDWILRRHKVLFAFLVAVPALSITLVFTNPWHGWFWRTVQLGHSDGYPYIQVQWGPWFWVHTVYSYVLLSIGAVWALSALRYRTGLFRRQAAVVLLGMLPVWIVNIAYLAVGGQSGLLDPTPIVLLLASFFYIWGIETTRFFDIRPLAIRSVVNSMADGVLVLDQQARIVDFNAAAVAMLGSGHVQLSMPVPHDLRPAVEQWSRDNRGQPQRTELALSNGVSARWHEVLMSPISVDGEHLFGTVLVVRDISLVKQREDLLRGQNNYLAALHQISLDLLDHRQLDELLQAIVERAAEILNAPFGEFLLMEDEELVVHACTANLSFIQGERVTRAMAKLSWQACDTAQPVVLDDYAEWSAKRAVYAGTELHAVADYPIVLNGACVGVLALGRSVPGYRFTPEDVEKGLMFSQLAALVLDNAQLYASAQHEIRERHEVERALRELNLSLEQRVADSTQRVRRQASAMDATAEGMAIIHGDRFLYVNPSYAALHGYARDELVGRSPQPLYALPDFHGFVQEIQPQLAAQGRWTGIVSGRHKAGPAMDLDLVLTAAGEDLVVSERDVTDRVAAERAVRQAEQRYRNLFAQAPTMYLTMVRLDGIPIITDCNDQMLTTLGYARDELVGHWLGRIYPPQPSQQVWDSDPHILDGTVLDKECELQARDGRIIAAMLRATPQRDAAGAVTGILAMYVDITARKQAEEQLRLLSEQLRRLAQAQANVREEERAAIAREIHDELGQMLTALKMDVVWVEKRLPAQNTQVSTKLATMSELVSVTIKAVQRLSAELRPGMLDKLGLPAAMEWQMQELQKRTDLHCSLRLCVPNNFALEPKLAIALFRVYQEALTNVIRHANAATVQAALVYEDGRLQLSIRDDGIGIAAARLEDPYSIGLTGMRERLVPWHGELEFYGIPGGGTTVCATVPYQQPIAETER